MAKTTQGTTTFYYYVPEETNANTQIVVFFDGSPGNSSSIFKKWFNENNPDFIIVRAPAGAKASDTYNFVTRLQTENGIDPSTTVHSTSYSAGSRTHLHFVRYQANHNPASVPSNITLFDSYGVNGANTLDACFNTQNSSNRITDADLENLSQYVNSITIFGRPNTVRGFVQNFLHAGIDVAYKWINGTPHGYYPQRVVSDCNMFNFIVHGSDFILPRGRSYFFDHNEFEGMSLKKIRNLIKNPLDWWLKKPDFLNILEILTGAPIPYMTNLDDYIPKSNPDVKFEIVDVNAKNKYQWLKDLDFFVISNRPEGFKTEINYVLGKMNFIRGLIRDSSFLDSCSTINFASSTGIPGCLSAYVNKYFDAVGLLSEKLAKATENVYSVGLSVWGLDRSLTEDQEEMLPSDGAVAPSGGSPVAVPSGGSLDEASSETPIETPQPDPPREDQIVVPEETPTEQPINEEPNEVDDSSQEPYKESRPQTPSDGKEKMKVLEDDSKVKIASNKKSGNSGGGGGSHPSTPSRTNSTQTNHNTGPVNVEPSITEEPVQTVEPTIPVNTEVVKEEKPTVTDSTIVEEKPTAIEPSVVEEKPVTPVIKPKPVTKETTSKTTTSSKTSDNISKPSIIEIPSNEVDTVETPNYEFEVPSVEPIPAPTPEPVIPAPTPIVEIPSEQTSSGSSFGDALKTAAIIGAAGAAIGGAAYGISELAKDKKYKDDGENYYSDTSDDGFVTTETYDDNMTPYEDKVETE